jgi:hypothetical protein
MIKHKIEVKADNGRTGNLVVEDQTYKATREIQKKIDSIVYQALSWQKIQTAKVGDEGKINLTVSWKCTWNGRAPKRPKDVIAAEKAAQAVKSQARKERYAKYQAEADERTVHLRQRIRNQVDHAFSLGKHGTESVAKYITCQHCDGPAAVVCLSQPLARGAAVLDEDTIIGALCQSHIQHQPWGYYSRNSGNAATKVPCSDLEFFYDGIRQIAIKS